jgi:hypothetical protein
MIKKLKKTELKKQFIGLKENKKMKMVTLRVRNGQAHSNM